MRPRPQYLRAALIGSFACLAAVSASAQSVAANPPGTGTVRGAITTVDGVPVGGATVRLVSERSVLTIVTESDESGNVVFTKVPEGRGWMHARRIGFRPDSIPVTISGDQPPLATLSMTRVAVELSAVRVLGRREIPGPMGGFFRRQQQNGGGHFFTAAELERRNAANMTDVFRQIPGMRIESNGPVNRVRMRNSRCAPLVWLDGQPLFAGEVDLDGFDPRTFDGIEIYSGPATVPVEFQGNQRMSSACGTIILWSKRGELRPKRRKKDDPTPTELIAQLVEKGEVFIVGDVDGAAYPDSTALVKPMYPDSLFEAQIPGVVLVEFVVDLKGRAMMETFSAVTTTHRQLVEPVRRAVQQQEFYPASRRGKVVQQVMQLPFHFVPDSTARRRR
jgi:hypothetical protein